jgi:hypothetical protein
MLPRHPGIFFPLFSDERQIAYLATQTSLSMGLQATEESHDVFRIGMKYKYNEIIMN